MHKKSDVACLLQSMPHLAHRDQPVREGNIHISAPHIYGYALEALDLTPNSSLSFLNIGSGTGYLTCIVATVLGPTSTCFGVELCKDAIEHCEASVKRYMETNPNVRLPHMEFIHGNGLNIDDTSGESLVGFDRIYVGASVERDHLRSLASLLRPGGVLVGPGERLKLTKSFNSTFSKHNFLNSRSHPFSTFS